LIFAITPSPVASGHYPGRRGGDRLHLHPDESLHRGLPGSRPSVSTPRSWNFSTEIPTRRETRP